MVAPEIHEHLLLKQMWKEFGINPKELADYDMAWVQLQMALFNEESRATEARMNRR